MYEFYFRGISKRSKCTVISCALQKLCNVVWRNCRPVSSSLSQIIHAKPSHHLHFTVRYHVCRTFTLSAIHWQVSCMQKLSHYLQFTATYHICRTVTLSPVHCHVLYMHNCRIVSSTKLRVMYADISHYLRFTIPPNNVEYFHNLLMSVVWFLMRFI